MGHTLTTAPQALPPLTKGHQLNRLLNITETYRKQMTALFTNNNLTTMDLGALPEQDRQAWYQLHKKNNRAGKLMTQLLIGK